MHLFSPHIFASRQRNCALFFLHLLLSLGLFYSSSIAAQEAICAEVKIEIKQKVNLERQAFDAVMRINNGLDGVALQNIAVTVKFTDASGTAVRASSDPNDTTASFFLRVDTLSGINAMDGTGTVAPKTSAEIHWLIIPASGAGGTLPTGKLYNVGATLNYRLGIEDKIVEVTPDTIIVKPQPLLVLDYFLANDVYADDPFTAVTEPAEPFTLGVRIKNIGGGLAKNTKIESAQPKIVENRQGLLIGFNIADSYINDQPAEKTLLVNFGDVGPGASKMARWNMLTTLMGNFVEFNAEYTHADSLGGALTSLIKSVATHLLVHDVKVDLAGRDNIRDFLALDGTTLRVYESEGIETDVSNASANAQLLSNGTGEYSLSFPASTGLVYVKLPDPSLGKMPPGPLTRSDGKRIPTENVWLSKVRDANLNVSHYINFFDGNTTGKYNLSQVNAGFANLSGFVYIDANGNGQKDSNESGLGATGVTLSGLSDAGIVGSTVAYAEPDGSFRFVQLNPGLYNLKVGPVSSYGDGLHLPGSAGGSVGTDAISNIKLPSGGNAQGYLFAKRLNTTAPSAQADVSILQTASNTIVPLGGTTILTLKISNSGPASASNVTVTDRLPAGLSLVFATATIGRYDTATSKWVIGDLTKDSSATLTLIVKVDQPGPLTNVASVASLLPDPNLTNNTASLTLNPKQDPNKADLRIAVLASELHNAPGDVVDVAIDIAKFGPEPVNGITLSVPLDPSFALVSATPNFGNYANGSWLVGELKSDGAAATLRLRGKPSGTNKISASVTEPSHFNQTKAGVVVLNAVNIEPDLSLELSSNAVQIPLNNEVILTYKIVNAGLVAATSEIAVDLGIPGALTIVSTQASMGAVFGVTGRWHFGNLAKGAAATLQVTARVAATEPIVVAGQIIAGDSNPTNNTARLRLNGPTQTANLKITQSVDISKPAMGEAVTLTLTVSNPGPELAQNVIANYRVPKGLNLTSTSMVPGGNYDAIAGLWAIGNMLPNSSATLTLKALVTSAGKISSNAYVLSSTADPALADNTSHLEISSDGVSDLALSFSVTKPNPPLKNLRLAVENLGPDEAKDLVIHLNKESLTVLSTFQASTGSYDSVRTWLLNSLPSGAKATLDLTIQPDPDLDLKSGATAYVHSLGTLDSSPVNDGASVVLSGNRYPATTNLSVSSTKLTAGETLILSVTVDGKDTNIPTGAVSFKTWEGVTLGTVTLDANGKASLSIANLSVGVHSIYAFYLGNEDYLGSSSATKVINVTP